MEIKKLNEWNPWWEDEKTIESLIGKPRPKYSELINSIDLREVIIITGVRRSGKSTLMYQMIDGLLKKRIDPKQILFINLEDKKITEDNLEDIYESYREDINPDKKAFVFLDEIHKRKGWESWIRKNYDLKKNIKFVISGSCSYLLKKEYSTLLTGRNLTFEIMPFTFDEYLEFSNIKLDIEKIKKGVVLDRTRISVSKLLKKYLLQGGFPEVVLRKEEFKMQLLSQYFDDILYKDIVDRYNLNSKKTKDLALYFMTNFTGLVSLRNLRNSLGLSYDTIKDYLSYFKEAFLFFIIDHFSYSFKEQKTLPSKVYCVDNGLRNAVSFKFSKDEGKLVENAVFIELLTRDKDVYYWKNKNEVDFIVKNKDNSLSAINVSFTDNIHDREIKALLDFKKEFKKRKVEMVLITKNTEKKQEGIKYIPLWKWLLNSGK
ncbi:MAG: ATP-binding protein [Nanoarchaeota archaeon]|nr:ATP-binding protein [Nanoarchaeota archaeon]MBU1027890.1 ATP-binding protein [Nanoarchaeota archaeon]